MPVTLTTHTNVAGGGGSFLPAVSADGQVVAFVSYAKNLVTNSESSPYLDVFVRDLRNGTTILVSANTSGHGGGDDNSNDPAISADGRFIAYASEAGNLVSYDTNRASDVFVFDRVAGATTLVSINRNGGTSWLRPSLNPVISANGRWVVFQSMAEDLADDIITSERVRHLYVRDLQAGKTYLVSAPAEFSDFNTLPGRYESYSPVITPDGSRIVYISTLTNLVPEMIQKLGGVYAYDLAAKTNCCVSAKVPAMFQNSPNLECFGPTLSADGRFAAFKMFLDANSSLLFYYDFTTA